jgi:hypothetical protein
LKEKNLKYSTEWIKYFDSVQTDGFLRKVKHYVRERSRIMDEWRHTSKEAVQFSDDQNDDDDDNNETLPIFFFQFPTTGLLE